MTKTLNQIFFFLHQNHNIFFSNIGNQNIFLEKNITPPPFKLNGRYLRFFKDFTNLDVLFLNFLALLIMSPCLYLRDFIGPSIGGVLLDEYGFEFCCTITAGACLFMVGLHVNIVIS
jgi:hypothetical protein